MTRGVLIPTSSEAEWLAARRQGITASEIAVVMGLSPWSSPYALFHRKLGNLPEQDDDSDDAMALGRYLEAYVAGRFALLDWWYVGGDGRGLYAHQGRPWQLATPDRLLYDWEPDEISGSGFARDPVAVLECKTDASYDGWGDDGTDHIPVQYRCQVLWQCDVIGVQNWYLACLFLHSRKLRVYEGTIDAQAEADLKLMRDEASDFLGRLVNGDEPDVDWRPATTSALKRLHPSVEDREEIVGVRVAISYRAACRRYKEAEQRKKLLENRLRAQMGNAARAKTWRGEPVARRDVYDLPEKTITRKATTIDRLVPVKPKETP